MQQSILLHFAVLRFIHPAKIDDLLRLHHNLAVLDIHAHHKGVQKAVQTALLCHRNHLLRQNFQTDFFPGLPQGSSQGIFTGDCRPAGASPFQPKGNVGMALGQQDLSGAVDDPDVDHQVVVTIRHRCAAQMLSACAAAVHIKNIPIFSHSYPPSH